MTDLLAKIKKKKILFFCLLNSFQCLNKIKTQRCELGVSFNCYDELTTHPLNIKKKQEVTFFIFIIKRKKIFTNWQK